MTYILTVSSQGQMIIPIQIRKIMGLSGGSKIRLRLEEKTDIPTATIQSNKVDWVKRMAGIGKGMYGNVDEYIKNERASWDRSKPWP